MDRRPTAPVSPLRGLLALLGLAPLLAGCGESPLLPPTSERIRIAFEDDLSRWPRAEWTLAAADVAGDSLRLTVRFAGGCRQHDFWLLAVRGWAEVPTAGPIDARSVPLVLAHDDRGDRCEAALTRSLRFDLTPLGRAYRSRFGDRPARIFLRLPEARGSSRVRLLEWGIP